TQRKGIGNGSVEIEYDRFYHSSKSKKISSYQLHNTLIDLPGPAGITHNDHIDIGAGRRILPADPSVPALPGIPGSGILYPKHFPAPSVEYDKLLHDAIPRATQHIKLIVMPIAIRRKRIGHLERRIHIDDDLPGIAATRGRTHLERIDGIGCRIGQ